MTKGSNWIMNTHTDNKPTGSSIMDWRVWQIIDTLSATFHKLSALILLLIIIAIWYQICSRLAHVSVSGITEAGGYLLIWICYFSIASTFKKGSHIKVDLLLRKLPENFQTVLSILSNLTCLAFSVIMAWESIKLVNMYYVINERSLFLHIHIFVVYLALPVGLFLFGLEAFKKIVFTLPLLWAKRG